MTRWLGVCLAVMLLGSPTAWAEDLNVVLVSGSEEYGSDESLAGFQTFLERNYPVQCTLLKAQGFETLDGTEALQTCDLALFFTRRLEVSGPALEDVKNYVLKSGKPIVGVRTASHGFQKWLEMDKLVFGGNYHGHFKNELKTTVEMAPEAANQPILRGFESFVSNGSLYKVSPLAEDAQVLLMGTSPEGKEPVAWIREFQGARVFYTSLGHPDDFKEPSFQRMLAQAILWAANPQ